MNRFWKLAGLTLLLVGLATSAAALPVTLTLLPSTLVLSAGQTLSLVVVVGGLDEDGGDTEIPLESFDLDLAFPNTLLAYESDSLSFGTSLGNPNDTDETFVFGPGANPNGIGVVGMGEFSSLTEAQLLGLQDAPFLLTTVSFTALANLQLSVVLDPADANLKLINLSGSSLGGVGGRALGDELAQPTLLLVTTVPEPSVAGLLLAAFALVGRRALVPRG